MKQEEILEKLSELVQQQTELSFINPSTTNEREALGILISKMVGFQPSVIVEILVHALIDSNAHEPANKIESLCGVVLNE